MWLFDEPNFCFILIALHCNALNAIKRNDWTVDNHYILNEHPFYLLCIHNSQQIIANQFIWFGFVSSIYFVVVDIKLLLNSIVVVVIVVTSHIKILNITIKLMISTSIEWEKMRAKKSNIYSSECVRISISHHILCHDLHEWRNKTIPQPVKPQWYGRSFCCCSCCCYWHFFSFYFHSSIIIQWLNPFNLRL